MLSPATREPAELVRLLAAADRRADLVEVRFDRLAGEVDPAALRAATPLPLLATVRRREEGGESPLSDAARGELLRRAVAAGFDLVDVEGFSPLADDPAMLPLRSRTILSFHDLDGSPADLAERLASLASRAPAAVKVVTTAKRLGDARPVLALLRRPSTGVPLAAFAMGEPGRPSRVLSPLLGGALTYVAVPNGGTTAPGQFTLDEAIATWGLDRPRAVPVDRLLGIVAREPGRTFSPRLHDRLCRRRGLPIAYLPIAIADWDAEMGELAAADGFLGTGLPMSGLTVTIPWKERAAAAAGELSEDAAEAGAANTLLASPRGWRGENTDVSGMIDLLRALGADPGRRVTVLGAGGAARAALVAARRLGLAASLAARDEAAGRRVAGWTGASFARWQAGENPPDSEILVNATSLGASVDDPMPVPVDALRPGRVVVDLVYRPGGTRLALAAADRVARVVDGYALLVAQGARQASLFHGRPVSVGELLGDLVLPTPFDPLPILSPDSPEAAR